MSEKVDCLFINPNASSTLYQGLSDTISAIETPTWALLLAESCRVASYNVDILDCDAERLTIDESTKRVGGISPKLVCFVVYGQNPNSGTTTMEGAIELARSIKTLYPEIWISFVGSHSTALPKEVLKNTFIDIVFTGEGVYPINNLLKVIDTLTHSERDAAILRRIRGIGFNIDYGDVVHTFINEYSPIVSSNLLDVAMPRYAWDLLPGPTSKGSPLSRYRAHIWHTNFIEEDRSPFAAIYTSLGCQFACDFCMINLVNRSKEGDNITAADSKGMRYWSTDSVINTIKQLVDLGVKNIRISDEMFFFNKKHYLPILERLIQEGLGKHLNMWAYARVDTVKEEYLPIFREAGVRYLALGIESANTTVRREITKGTYEETDVREIVRLIRDHDINVIANYIFGLPDDNFDTMNETLNLAIELNTEMANFYPTQALPGSPLYKMAREQGWSLPTKYSQYSFYSKDCLPLRTKYLTPQDVLSFRDHAWTKYFTRPEYLNMMESRYGPKSTQRIREVSQIKLERDILKNYEPNTTII